MSVDGFAGRLRELRESAGMTQKDLADKAGMNQFGVAKLEQGVTKPTWETVLALAAALGVTCEAFQVEAEERQPPGRGRPRKIEAPTEPPKEPEAPARSSGKKPKTPTTGKPKARKKKAD